MTEIYLILFTFVTFGVFYLTNKENFDRFLSEEGSENPKIKSLKRNIEKTIDELRAQKDERGMNSLMSALNEIQGRHALKVTEVRTDEESINELNLALEAAFSNLANEEVLNKSYAVIRAKKAIVDRQVEIFHLHADDHDFSAIDLDVKELFTEIKADSPVGDVLNTVEKKAFQDMFENTIPQQ